MATLVSTPKDLLAAFTHREGEDWDVYFKRSQAKLEEMNKAAAALPEGEIKGALLSFPYADGHAIYLVVSAQPLKLAHVPYGDAWQIGAPTIRGLRFADALQMVQRERGMRAIFAGRKTKTTA